MTISLKKTESINLNKSTGKILEKITVGLGWRDIQDNKPKVDIDVSILLLDKNNEIANKNEKNVVFFNNLKSPDGAVVHQGDNRKGVMDSVDAETIKINLSQLDSNVENIHILVNIYEALEKNQHFGNVKDAYIRLIDDSTGEEILRYDLTEDFKDEIFCHIANLSRDGNDFKFQAIGIGKYLTLQDVLEKEYGLVTMK